jgi:hypothetical protein
MLLHLLHLIFFFFPTAMAGSPLLSFPLLIAFADLNISFLISSITCPTAPVVGSPYVVFSTATLPYQWVDQLDPPYDFPHIFWP